MIYKVTSILLIVFAFSCNQKFDCKTFKEGHFLIKPDSIPSEYYFNIYRNDTEQVEIDQNGKKTFVYINWISSCSYEVKSVPNKGNDFKVFNDNSVVRVELFKTIGDTAFYRTYIFTKKGTLPATAGRMFRISDSIDPPN